MVELTRTVRFCINPDEPLRPNPALPADNTFAGHPSMRGLGRYYELDVTCRGRIDPNTGYFINIKAIDQAVREQAVPIIARACQEHPNLAPDSLLPQLLHHVNAALHNTVFRIRWRLTPFYSLELIMSDQSHPPPVLLRQQFEFAASHRLHSPHLSDDENRRVFGKCNHPGGHGHNYRVEPCVAIPAASSAQQPFTLADLERLTARTILDRFDHKNLNEDCPEFRCTDKGGRGLNPSVENIAMVCYELLAPAIKSDQASLRSITVWETDKTSCTYPVV